MELTSVKELYRNRDNYADKKVTVGGWVRGNRDSKTFGFLVVNDGTFFETLQVVYSADKINNFEEIAKLNVGAAVIVTGTIVATPNAKQPFEMQAEEVFVEGTSTADYPYRKNVIVLNTFVPFLTFVQELTHSRQYSVCVPWQHMRFTNSSRKENLYM